MPSDPLHSHVWTPGPDDSPFRIRNTADVLSLALAWSELPRFDLLIAVLDRDHRVIRIVTDPSAETVCFPARGDGPAPAPGIHGIAVLSMAFDEPDAYSHASLFAILRRHFRSEGIRFVDWIVIDLDPDGFRSMRLESQGKRRAVARRLRAGTCV